MKREYFGRSTRGKRKNEANIGIDSGKESPKELLQTSQKSQTRLHSDTNTTALV